MERYGNVSATRELHKADIHRLENVITMDLNTHDFGYGSKTQRCAASLFHFEITQTLDNRQPIHYRWVSSCNLLSVTLRDSHIYDEQSFPVLE
jgi:hypothetical protein